MRWFAGLGLLAMAGCAPELVTSIIPLKPANEIAVQDGIPIARLTGYAGDPRATVSFAFADGETLAGNAMLNQDVENTMTMWGQKPQALAVPATVTMLAINDSRSVNCRGNLSQFATYMTCDFSDGAVYQDIYTAPPPPPRHAKHKGGAGAGCATKKAAS